MIQILRKDVTVETQENNLLLFFNILICSVVGSGFFPSSFSVSVVVALLFLLRLLRTF